MEVLTYFTNARMGFFPNWIAENSVLRPRPCGHFCAEESLNRRKKNDAKFVRKLSATTCQSTFFYIVGVIFFRGGFMKKSHLFLALIALIGFFFVSCANEIEDSKTYIVFSSGSRAAETEKSVENLTEISLSGKSSAGTLDKSWEKWSELLSDKIELDAGECEFSLTAKLDDEKYSATTTQKIEAGKENAVSFTLKKSSESESSESETAFTVTFNTDGGSEIASQSVEKDGTVSEPAEPTKDGCVFLGWFTDADFSTEFDFAEEILADTTLYAKWIWIPEGFVFVPGTTINGDESWTPSSDVFLSGRKLTIPNLFACEHEVTRGDYSELIGSLPYGGATPYDKDGNEFTGDSAQNNPVSYVSWYEALVYCNRLSIKEGLTPCYTISDSTDPDSWGDVPDWSTEAWNAAICNFEADGYSLPTEAEWEWLVRGGQSYKYAGSDTADDVAWTANNTFTTEGTTGSRDVMTKAANGYGLYDMCGNVCEWCWDWKGDITESIEATGNLSGSKRVLRGGSWSDVPSGVAYRYFSDPNNRDDGQGFRVVRTVK